MEKAEAPSADWLSKLRVEVSLNTVSPAGETWQSSSERVFIEKHFCRCGVDKSADKTVTTVIADIFVRDLISYISYFWLEVRNLVGYENHARIQVHDTQPSLYEIWSVRKLGNARVRNFYAYENFYDYGMCVLGILANFRVRCEVS